jgi:hypothetical protein
MSYSLVNAYHFRDIPKVMRTAARNYRKNIEDNKALWEERGDYRQAKIWDYAASLMEQSAAQLELRIEELKLSRPRLKSNPLKPKRERLRKL